VHYHTFLNTYTQAPDKGCTTRTTPSPLDYRAMASETFTLQKRHLGWLMFLLGLIGLVGVFSIDLITIVNQSGLSGLFSQATIAHLRSPMGIGPAQQMALSACAGITLVGLSLIPVGKHPA
jgi:hypothetical protein